MKDPRFGLSLPFSKFVTITEHIGDGRPQSGRRSGRTFSSNFVNSVLSYFVYQALDQYIRLERLNFFSIAHIKFHPFINRLEVAMVLFNARFATN